MSKMLVWDQPGDKKFRTGVEKVALYVQEGTEYPKGVAWSGVTAINESPSGAEATALYADNIKYMNLVSAEELGLTIEAYYSPEEFDACDGAAEIAKGVKIGQQNRRPFGLAYRTTIGNDTVGNGYGYVIHLIYGCTAAPSEKANSTINDSPEAATLSWEVATTPVNVTGFKPTASVEIDSTMVDKEKLATLEGILYGSETADARLPLPNEIMQIMGVEA